jgi:hypothetical protein
MYTYVSLFIPLYNTFYPTMLREWVCMGGGVVKGLILQGFEPIIAIMHELVWFMRWSCYISNQG